MKFPIVLLALVSAGLMREGNAYTFTDIERYWTASPTNSYIFTLNQSEPSQMIEFKKEITEAHPLLLTAKITERNTDNVKFSAENLNICIRYSEKFKAVAVALFNKALVPGPRRRKCPVEPYEDKTAKAPIIVFKYDSTRRNELKMVLEMHDTEVVDFGIFERDKPPEAKIIAMSIEEFDENVEEKTGYEAFVCVVKKIGSEAFLTFAGIGPYHVSENPETAVEEAKLYFPDVSAMDESQSDDEEKPDEEEANAEGGGAENPELVITL